MMSDLNEDPKFLYADTLTEKKLSFETTTKWLKRPKKMSGHTLTSSQRATVEVRLCLNT